jgi:predicted CoA-binding protein
MARLAEQAKEFLAQKRIAVAGVTREPQSTANGIYKRLKETDHEVYGVNPNAQSVLGDPCFPDLQAIPGGVDGVVVVTTPSVTEQIVQQCIEAKVPRLWIHKSFGDSSSKAAIELGRDHNIDVLAGGCPMMFIEPVDGFHKCFRFIFSLTGRIPH